MAVQPGNEVVANVRYGSAVSKSEDLWELVANGRKVLSYATTYNQAVRQQAANTRLVRVFGALTALFLGAAASMRLYFGAWRCVI
jgi:hypothetical protein